MTWREFIEEHEGETGVLAIVNEEFAKMDGASYDDEMPTWSQHRAVYRKWKEEQSEADIKLGKALGNALSDDVIDRLLKDGSVRIKISL